MVAERARELFHYTSLDALENIFRSRQFWATYHADMNDVSEQTRFRLKAISYILPLVVKKFRRRMRNDKEFASRVAKAGGLGAVSLHDAEAHVGSMHESIFGRLPGPFIASFCLHQPNSYEARNGLLSMWRGYGSTGGVNGTRRTWH